MIFQEDLNVKRKVDETVMQKALTGFDKDDVLIGGQSILFWCNHFDINHDIKGALTDDIDVLGTQDSVFNIAEKTKGTAQVVPGTTFGTSLIGQVTVNVEAKIVIEIDVLSKVLGVEKSEAIQFATPVTIHETSILVLNPLHCLKSKSFNYTKVLEKQDEYGFVQAQLSTKIANFYLLAIINDEDWDTAIQGIEYVHKLAASSIGKFCAKNGINIYDAIPVDNINLINNKNFIEKRLPRLMDSISTHVQLINSAEKE